MTWPQAFEQTAFYFANAAGFIGFAYCCAYA